MTKAAPSVHPPREKDISHSLDREADRPTPPPERATEKDYLLSTSFEALGHFVSAVCLYFVFIIVILVFTAPPTVRAALLVQKGLYLAGLLRIMFDLHRGRIAASRYNTLLTLVLLLCLTSTLFTAASGQVSRAGTYSVILLLGCALVEVSFGWATFHWALIWTAWLTVAASNSYSQGFNELLMLVGVQLVAIAGMSIRLRLFRAQFQTMQWLKKALQESEKMRETLDRQVDSRTQQLVSTNEELRLSVAEREQIAREKERLREQLLQSQKMESLGRLAGGVAHDFNNLLTVISGNIELARMEQLSAEVSELLDSSNAAARRASELTGQLLAFSRKQVMKTKPFKIQASLERSIKLAHRLLGEDIKLDVSLRCPDVMVEGDPSQIEQALLNLVVNARDAMPGGGTLGITLERKGSEVKLTVSDTGQGIPLDKQGRIFEPFYTSKPMGQGTGLGLSTVHGVVSKHKGRVEVESAPGQGARFTISLPVGSVRGNEHESASNLPVPALPGTGTILLVEDDDQVRNLAVRALKMSGYVVRAFACAKAGLASLEDEGVSYDVLCTDVVMPGMDGAALAEAVRSRLPGLPVLFMSGYTDDRISSFGLLSRDDCGFLNKPFVPIALQKAVADVLRGSKRDAESAAAVAPGRTDAS